MSLRIQRICVDQTRVCHSQENVGGPRRAMSTRLIPQDIALHKAFENTVASGSLPNLRGIERTPQSLRIGQVEEATMMTRDDGGQHTEDITDCGDRTCPEQLVVDSPTQTSLRAFRASQSIRGDQVPLELV